jgi:hypothetical protein
MTRKLLVLWIIMQVLLPVVLYSQTRSAFTGEREKFLEQLKTFMGPNLNEDQTKNLDAFIVKWDSAVYSSDNMVSIMDISSQLSSRYMRPVPHFESFIKTLNYFVDFKRDEAFLASWLKGLSELAFSPRYTNENIYMFLKNSSSMIRNNVLYESGTVTWKVKNSELKFRHDTVFYVSVKNATLTCYSQKDSTEIYNVTGDYYPEFQLFRGAEGKITWEKAGYAINNVYAEIKNYKLNTARNNFTADSARFIHSSYFTTPVYGVLSDQAASFSSKEKATFPKFTTYTGKFFIKDIYKGVDYEGGLTFEGANVKGTGTNYNSAKISMHRNDTLYMRIASREFIFSKTGINSNETSLTLFLDKDSIYHSDLGFTYIAGTRQVNLFRTNNPVSGSPYFNSFHDVDMYFDYLSWNMNESNIHLSRARGASIGQARFESSSFFYSDYFLQLMGMDEYHPLNRLVKFAEWYYSNTFPVSEFAKWLNRPQEYVTGLCIDLANKGFIFYDRVNNEVTIKQKTRDFLDFYAKRKDYDVLSIRSETEGSVDNASLDLKNFRLTINGVQNVFLSDSQMVSIHPYNQQIVLGRNRDIMFDGVVQAGLFTIFGHNFSFSYDTFKIRLQKIDSIKIAVETGEKDRQGRSLIRDVDNLIQLGTAELYIDRPDNKSGLKSLAQYPIINALTYSYIFYDKLPGLEGVYPQKDFYFRLDPFTYENIDHYSSEDMNLPGEFRGGNILKPIKQILKIQDDNSLGFNMNIPEEGIEVYDSRGVLYENLYLNNRGLTGKGKLNHLASQTISDEFKFYPDSMLAHASSFKINDNTSGVFPLLNSEEVDIKWLIPEDKWLATSSTGKNFDMFENGTALNGTIIMTPKRLEGSGVIEMSDSRITSSLFNFTANSVKADTADYNIKSRTTDGYSFIAENANTNINFDEKLARFSLNTDSSMVKFPEIQYICTMTNFVYNLESRVLEMEQKGKSQSPLLTAEELIRVNRGSLNKPTFFSTNNLSDTIEFSSWKGSYYPDKEMIIAENINYIPVADALIQPENGKITINRRATIQELQNAIVAVNNKHLLHNATINIESSKRYNGNAVYDYVDENKEIQQISFPEITVDTLTTTAKGSIASTQKFMLSPAFSFEGDVMLNARADRLTFTGSAGIVNDCSRIESFNIKFKSPIDPLNIMIPVGDKPRDHNDNPVFSGSFISADSLQIYPAFLSAQKSWADIGIVTANGFLYYDKLKSTYIIASEDKIADRSIAGNMVALDRNNCVLSGEGAINFGAKYDLFKMASAGTVNHLIDSGKVTIQAMLGLDFYFSPEALNIMAEELRLVPSLKQVNLNSDFNSKGMRDLFGYAAADRIKEEMTLFGTSRNMPKEYTYELFLNDVTLQWNETTSSFRSTGKIGVGFVGTQPLNLYLDGYIEIQRRRSGDMIDVYLKANDGTWYYFSYFRGVMMTQAANGKYNSLISEMKASARKHPESSVRVPYSFMIAVEDRLSRFLRRMTSNEAVEDDTSVR